MKKSQAVMLYDGDCAFCSRWIRHWQSATGEAVRYVPFQQGLADHPQVTREACEKAVQLVLPGGAVLSGAQAVFKALALAGKHPGWLWSYEHFPGFSFLTEAVYRVIARRRSFFSRFF